MMLRAYCLVTTVLLSCAFPAFAAEGPDLGANAALHYWQAFATLPKLSDAEQTKLITECLKMPLDDHARDLVAKADYSLALMRSGSALPRCAWGIDWEEHGIYTLLPHLTASRVLTSLACLRARQRFEAGQNAEAVNDLVAAVALARNVSRDGTLLAVLVEYATEGHIGDAIAMHLPQMKREEVQALRQRLEQQPAGERPATALRYCEERTLEWFISKVKEAKDKEHLIALFTTMGITEGKPDAAASEKARSFLTECGGTAEGVVKFAEEARPCYALMAAKLDLPLDQFVKEFDREAKQRAGNPVFKVFFPALPKCRESQARAEVRRGLLAAAFAVQLDGQAALKDHPDPVAGGTFDYTAFNGGFELRSKYKGADDKPLTLTVGRRSK